MALISLRNFCSWSTLGRCHVHLGQVKRDVSQDVMPHILEVWFATVAGSPDIVSQFSLFNAVMHLPV